ncbi:MAG: hypothetical protein JWM35_2335 [Verrucomicrobia bacterium]|nr:hypothetical protein [Verrucomicrobiota bacterium]
MFLGLALVTEARPAGLQLPPIHGELSGDFKSLQLAGAPQIHWSLTIETGDEHAHRAIFKADGPGTHLVAAVQLDETGEGSWRISEGQVELKSWFAGQFTSGRADVSGEGRWQDNALSGDITLKLRDVNLGELAKFADPDKTYVRTATGKIEGIIRARIRNGAISAGDSALRLPTGTVATVTFAPSPGLLTGYVPAQVLKLYPGIGAIELGKTPLEAKVLQLVFHPEGDAEGRGARLRIEGRPLDPKIIAPLELEVNFTGPLESLLRKALDSRLKVGGGK